VRDGVSVKYGKVGVGEVFVGQGVVLGEFNVAWSGVVDDVVIFVEEVVEFLLVDFGQSGLLLSQIDG
jgi:hypothetical protein